ncbi:MAG: PEP/pyruvate-binding domain-containing protein [Desulfuromusa sp.]|nr:PEP/pyruvate-binding domain-containing protein [Desulfuromusa sp.]
MPLKKSLLTLIIFLFWISPSVTAATFSSAPAGSVDNVDELPEPETLRSWIEQIKNNQRGPFKRIRWFCQDGEILPPKSYACREHGGGVQHGEWSEQVKLLRQHNYLIGNLLADLSPDTFFVQPDWNDRLKQIILEQFLREADNGWIFRQARYYRGAIQSEDENWHGHSLLLGLLQQPKLLNQHFLLLREAVRLLPHGQDSPPLTAMRQLAQTIEEQDPAFTPLRIKLHSQPEATDATAVRRHAETGLAELQEEYLQLAELISEVSQPQIDPFHAAQQLQFGRDTRLIKMFAEKSNDSVEQPVADRFTLACQLLAQIRTELAGFSSDRKQLRLLDLSLQLEFELYRTANQLLNKLPEATRRQRLTWVGLGVDALYGTGMLSTRERDDLSESLQTLLTAPVSVDIYQRELGRLVRLTRWAENRLHYHFETQVSWLARLDSAFQNFVPERLRSSPLLPISRIIDGLQTDSQQLRGVSQHLFGAQTTGLQPLNPGLARGRLEIVADPQRHRFTAEGIYLLPETVENLPPVAGILTRAAGNSLSHIQLLARNLGIPNIAISNHLENELIGHAGEIIVVAVSPGGVVQIANDSAEWRHRFNQQKTTDEFLINPDLDKLDLQQKQILGLEQIGAADSGRIAGPKGANLGELKKIYTQLVPDALVIPFGRFRSLLNNNQTPDGQNLFNWMSDNYRRLEQISDSDEKRQQTAHFLASLQEQIKIVPLPEEFLAELRTALEKHFGPDGSFGVFVRSDTNVEDLPNFTGAGLNKTVPHVVGFDNILAAIRKVWASPFSLRAYSWRQAHMRSPEHVYASVLLMLSVPAEKSGVMATTDLFGGDREQIHVATNEGVGGAVSGQRAEEILIDKKTGQVRLLAQASATQKRILLPTGGIRKVTAEAPPQLLTKNEIQQLREMAELLPSRFPSLRDEQGLAKPADIEFGFLDGNFVLFQIRPLLESKRVKKDLYLSQLDAAIEVKTQSIDLEAIPAEP